MDGQYPRRIKDREGNTGLQSKRTVQITVKDSNEKSDHHRLASNDPGSNVYACVGVAVAVGGETFTSGCAVRVPLRVIVEDKRVLPGAPFEPEVTPTETVLRS